MKAAFAVSLGLAILASLCAVSPAAAGDSDNAKAYLDVATQLRGEAGLTEDRELKKGLLMQSGEAFLRSADGLSSEQAQKALLDAAATFRLAGGEDTLAKVITVTFLIERRFQGTDAAAKALVARGEVYAEQKEWGRAVASWTKVHKEHPSSEAAPEALFKSGQIFADKIKNTDEATKAFGAVLKDYPKSDVADDALFAQAQLKEDAKQYAEAATDYLALSKRFPDSSLADKAMFAAINIYDKSLKDYRKAHDQAVEFRKLYPHSEFLKKVESIEQKTMKYVG